MLEGWWWPFCTRQTREHARTVMRWRALGTPAPRPVCSLVARRSALCRTSSSPTSRSTRPPCFPGLPRTWVPVPCVEVHHKRLKAVTRTGLPLRLAWALTIHKCQGITAHEGCIVSFDGCRAASAVAKMGLAFVAWARATLWRLMAFHKLPPFADFLAARLTREFAARADFESKADGMFADLLQRRGTSLEALLAEHEEHLRASTLLKDGRLPSSAELADMRAMLRASGVASISESATAFCEQHSGRKALGLWSFVAAFRAQRKPRGGTGRKERGQAGLGPGAASSGGTLPPDGAVAEDAAAQTMIDMGFAEADITRALEETDFAFGRALLLLLNGLDKQRAKYDTLERFRRHGSKTVRALGLAGSHREEAQTQYSQRARDEFHFDPVVLDLGQFAGRTAGACFWLCLAAGLAECGPDVCSHALPGQSTARLALAELRAEGVQRCMEAGVRHSPLGRAAEALRVQFCAGDAPVLLRPDMRARVFPAFAGLNVRGPARTDALYTQWVQKLATKEYADELVVLCVALELSIRITVIPFTPLAALAPWAVTTYGPAGADGVIYVGNNDVHYVYLSQRQ